MRGSAIDESALSDTGFEIRTAGAQLADLIQINCQNRISGVFRIRSAGHEAYLFFEDGRVMYAEHGEQHGLDAVASMLALRGGVIEPCSRPWPSVSCLDFPADTLLLRAAQRLDESRRTGERPAEPTTAVVRRIRTASDGAPAEAHAVRLTASDIVESTDASWEETLEEPAPLAPRALLKHQLAELRVVQLSAEGDVLQLKHGATEELADSAFFVYRLGALIGETLALDECKAVHLHNAELGLVVFRGRSVVGAGGKLDQLSYVLSKAGLASAADTMPPPPPIAGASASEVSPVGTTALPSAREPNESDSGLRYSDGTSVRLDEAATIHSDVARSSKIDLLSCLQHVKGVVGSYVSSLDGRLLISAMPLGFPQAELETTSARVANLVHCGDESLGHCFACQLRFHEHLLTVTRHDFGLLCVLTTGTPDRALLRVSTRMAARRLQEGMS